MIVLNEIKFQDFEALHEFVILENFDKKVKDKAQFKKAVKTGNAPKKAVLINKAPNRIKGPKFTLGKLKHHGRMIHYTNAKNSFIRSQKRKSQKGIKNKI